MNKCVKIVGGLSCDGCLIKYGCIKGRQRYQCKKCKCTQMVNYISLAYGKTVNQGIVDHLKEGCGIRSIARLLTIAPGTVLSRIKQIATQVTKPAILTNRIYEVDELRTYVGNKDNDCWVIYALDKQNGQVVDMKVGKRTKANLQLVIETLLMSNCKQIYTDGLKTYRYIIPTLIHKTKRYGINRIERKNLTLRTHLKRLNRKTICYSKSIEMLDCCLKIIFWYPSSIVLIG